ncbi:hypothetical protein Vadar_027127 [Vaccinium darrowii]|uniref:Uncharacterized protein n=1 Tax=Vaccinium darrowii TaxID=229202 RepID=A0ACB7X4Y7_9ERIC|nr:hypothetical protein Vadar_027127 [Vaccinium darrowii]
MPSIVVRIFLLYNLLNTALLYFNPKKLRTYLPTSWYTQQISTTTTNRTSTTPPPPPPPPQPASAAACRMDSCELRRVFEMFDKNGDEKITKEELKDSLENMGIFIADQDLSQMIERVDENGDGCVDVEEFGALYNSIMDGRDEGEEEDMKEAFNVFDKNGDGFIVAEELEAVMAALGLKQGREVEDWKRMIMKVDGDGDGMREEEEFEIWVTTTAAAAAADLCHRDRHNLRLSTSSDHHYQDPLKEIDRDLIEQITTTDARSNLLQRARLDVYLGTNERTLGGDRREYGFGKLCHAMAFGQISHPTYGIRGAVAQFDVVKASRLVPC